jgi:nucleoside-diphosphate-sugar epimerase
MARTVVVGASGLVGRALIGALAPTEEVVAVVRTHHADMAGVNQVMADLVDPSFTDALPKRADAVVHLAQSDRYASFPDCADHVVAVNLYALAKLLSWCRNAEVQTFVHASTGGLYGRGATAFTEADPVQVSGPLSFYFRTKQCAEYLAHEYAGYFSVVALRPFFIYGRRQRANMLLPRLIASIRDGRPIRLARPHGMRLNPLHVFDMVTAVQLALGLRGNHLFNVAGPEILSIRSIAETLGRALRRKPLFELEPEDPAGDVIGDISNLRQLGWSPRILFEQGAQEICREAETW